MPKPDVAADPAPKPDVARCGSETELLGPPHQIVALDMGHVHVQTEPLGKRAHRRSQTRGIQPAGVGNDPYAKVECGAQTVFELPQERLGIAALGRLRAVAGQDQHGQLGEVVAGEVVQVAAREHLAHRRQPVPVEPRAVADANRAWR